MGMSINPVLQVAVFASLLSVILCQQGQTYEELCRNRRCLDYQECRLVKPCNEKENCSLTTQCVDKGQFDRSYCRSGKGALLKTNLRGPLDYLSCYREAQCPDNAYCSTVLMDVGSACCFTNSAAPPIKSGLCPVPTNDTNPIFCYDECVTDGDCYWNDKCCNTGCSKKCIPPRTPVIATTPPIPPIPSIRDDTVDVCANTRCLPNQECRLVKLCNETQTCRVIGECVEKKTLARPYCKQGNQFVGNALLKRKPDGSLAYLTCYMGASCPSGAYCSNVLMDVSSACCPSDRSVPTLKNGICPVPEANPNPYSCYGECNTDGDCHGDSKCCDNGCAKKCMRPMDVHPPLLTPGPSSCSKMICPVNQMCRLVKPCGEKENCPLRAMCTDQIERTSGCNGRYSILQQTRAGFQSLPCYAQAPCPDNAYCSTVLQDIGAFCCLSNPVNKTKDGTCPYYAPEPSQAFCTDECRHDGDCGWDDKCCFTGCSRQCIPPRRNPVTRPQRDPCDTKRCHQGYYCRRRGQPCRTPWNCRPEGQCVKCEGQRTIHPRFNFRLVQDSDGCHRLSPIITVPRQGPPPYQSRNPASDPVQLFLMWMYNYLQ